MLPIWQELKKSPGLMEKKIIYFKPGFWKEK